jgi:hypothetical protein
VQRIVEHDERCHGHEQATDQTQAGEAPRPRVAGAGAAVSSGLDLPRIHADNRSDEGRSDAAPPDFPDF